MRGIETAMECLLLGMEKPASGNGAGGLSCLAGHLRRRFGRLVAGEYLLSTLTSQTVTAGRPGKYRNRLAVPFSGRVRNTEGVASSPAVTLP